LSGQESEPVVVSISVLEDGVGGVNDNIRDGSRGGPGRAIGSGASRGRLTLDAIFRDGEGGIDQAAALFLLLN